MTKQLSRLSLLLLSLIISEVVMAQKANVAPSTSPFVLGVIDEIQSAELGETRVLNIYLPEGYNKNDSIKYPVVYLLDGSADEDFIHIVGLYQFYSFPWIEVVQKTIIVGIASVDRRRDFTYPTTIQTDKEKYPTTGQSKRFISFLEKELQPYVEKNYKTNSEKTIIGQSLGGLMAAEILLTKPGLFNKYIIVSPSLWWDNGSLLKVTTEKLTRDSTQPLYVYIGVGKEGVVPGDNPRVMEVDANVLADKISSLSRKNLRVFFDYLPKEDHATILHIAVYNALRFLHSTPGCEEKK